MITGLPKTIEHKGKKYNLIDTQYSKINADLAGQIYAKRFPKARWVISSVFNKDKETFGIYTSMEVSDNIGDYGRIKKPQKPKTYAQKMADKKKLEMPTGKQIDAYALGKGYKRTPGKMVGWFGKSTEPIDIIKEANHQISQLTRTGMRVVKTIKPGYLVIWSNGSRAWRARTGSSSVIPPGEHKLDANMIIIEAPKAVVNRIEGHLNELPLYSNSFEARYKPKSIGKYNDNDVKCKYGMTYDDNSACKKCENKGKPAPACPFNWMAKPHIVMKSKLLGNWGGCPEFENPGSALRRSSKSNPRKYPCPTCKQPNRLTAQDKAKGYQCDACADRAEGCGCY